MAPRCIFLLLLLTTSWLRSSRAIEPTSLISLGLSATEHLFSILDKFEVIENVVGKSMSTKKFVKEMYKLNSQISKVESHLSSGEATMKLILSKLNQNTRLELKMDELSDLITRLNIAHNRMNEYTGPNFAEGNPRGNAEDETLMDFARWCVSHDTGSVVSMLERIHSLVVPDAKPENFIHTGLLQLISNDMAESNYVCTMRQSPNQLIYNMYNTIALTEIKGYIMMQFSYMLLKIYGKGNFSKEIQDMQNRYEERTRLTIAAVKGALTDTSRELWRCDPKEHIKNKTYVSMTRLFEGYIANEADMSDDKQCWKNCDAYTVATHKRCYDHEENCAVDPPCEGKILNCKYVDSDMWICPGKSRDRRYEYIEYENKKILGKKTNTCQHLRKVDSWWRYLFWHCSYCMCICDDESRSDRFISMREMQAETSSNKVITGLRFIKKRQVIYLQMSTGVLMESGKIDRTTIKWEPVKDIDLERDSEGIHYHKFSFNDRALDLDILEGPKGHLLTGVRFRKLGSHLNMEIMITPFNFTTGKLITPSLKSHWHSSDSTDVSDVPRSLVHLGQECDIPTNSIAPSEVDSVTDQYIEFIHTGLEKDAAQTTIPFFDAQPVIPDYPVPLSGAGLYHKGQKGYGGFIGIKLLTYDFSQHLEAVFPQTDDVVISYIKL